MDAPNDLLREKKRQKLSENHDWSKLCPDLLQKIIESLNYIDSYQAITVCSDWYSVWKTCVKPLYPWRIIYHEDYSMMLFDPREDKVYTTKLLGLSDRSRFMASSGNWLLMVEYFVDFYIFNVVTRKRINLPSMESPFYETINLKVVDTRPRFYSPRMRQRYPKPRGMDHDSFGRNRSAVLWIDERTGDYVVVIFDRRWLLTYKKGDDSWRNWSRKWKSKDSKKLGYLDLAYRNSKLYIYTSDDRIKIIDFSGDFPKKEIERNPYRNHPFHYHPQELEYLFKKRIAIQKSGEVLIILSLYRVLNDEKIPLFYIFKMNLESGKWERVLDSIGDDEMVIFGYGVTIRAPVRDLGDGIKSDSICFVEDEVWPGTSCPSCCGVFDLATNSIKWPKQFRIDKTQRQWFVPRFA